MAECNNNKHYVRKRPTEYWGPSDWTTSTRLSTSTIFEFQTSDVSRALVLHVGFR